PRVLTRPHARPRRGRDAPRARRAALVERVLLRQLLRRARDLGRLRARGPLAEQPVRGRRGVPLPPRRAAGRRARGGAPPGPRGADLGGPHPLGARRAAAPLAHRRRGRPLPLRRREGAARRAARARRTPAPVVPPGPRAGGRPRALRSLPGTEVAASARRVARLADRDARDARANGGARRSAPARLAPVRRATLRAGL